MEGLSEAKLKGHGPDYAHAHEMPFTMPRKPSLWLPLAVLWLIHWMKFSLRHQAIHIMQME